jgi:hypothetical protein
MTRRVLARAVVAVLLLALPGAAAPPLFEARSNVSGRSTMDIVVREVERRPRASVLEIEIRAVGSSVGASFFLLCSVRKLALERGGYRFVVKAEEHPRRGHMLVGFLTSAEEPPENADAAFRDLAGAQVVALEQFAPICDAAK